MTVDVLSPFLSKQTQYFGPYIIGTTSESMGMGMGWLDTRADIWRSSEGVNLNALVTHWARVQGPAA